MLPELIFQWCDALKPKNNCYSFADLFCGIGGFHIALHELGATCLMACDNDPLARKTYEANFRKISPALFNSKMFLEKIEFVDARSIPDFDILCAGFPCQPFSQAGYKKGFKDAGRGELFFEIARIIEAKRPAALFLENVRHIVQHDEGRTISTIQRVITKELGYTFKLKVVRASDHGLPQHRPRAYMICFDGEKIRKGALEFEFPPPTPLKKTMSDVFGGACDRDVGFTLRCGGRRSGIDNRWNWDSYRVDGLVRCLSSTEGKRMMGFPESFTFPVSESDAMHQLGNSVAVNAVKAVAQQMIRYLKSNL